MTGWLTKRTSQRQTWLATFRCSCNWTSCCLVRTSCFFWNSANSSCFWSSCCCFSSTSSCWSCCSLRLVSTAATPPEWDPTLGSVRRSTGPPLPPPPGPSAGPPSDDGTTNKKSALLILINCWCQLSILCACIEYFIEITSVCSIMFYLLYYWLPSVKLIHWLPIIW